MAEIWNYETIKELLYAPGLGHYFTYGLLAARKINSVWEPVEFIHDVTTDYQLVKKNGGAVQSLPAVSHPPSRRDRGYASINLEIKNPALPLQSAGFFHLNRSTFCGLSNLNGRHLCERTMALG